MFDRLASALSDYWSALFGLFAAMAWPIVALTIVLILLPEIRQLGRVLATSRKAKASVGSVSIEWEMLALETEKQVLQTPVVDRPAIRAMQVEIAKAEAVSRSNPDRIQAAQALVRQALLRASPDLLHGQATGKTNGDLAEELVRHGKVDQQLAYGVRALDDAFASFSARGADPGDRNARSFEVLARTLLERIPVVQA